MSEPEDQRLSSYGFELPERLIAQRPVEPRHAARLLVVEPQAAAAANGKTVGSGSKDVVPGDGPGPLARHRRGWHRKA